MTLLKRLDSRIPRLLFATCIVIALSAVVMERAVYRTSVEAVVNAPRVEITAPIEGVIDTVGAAQGTAVRAGALLVRLRRDAWATNGDPTLGARSALLRARVDIVAHQLSTLLEMQEELSAREQRYRATVIERLESDLRAAQVKLAERRLSVDQALAMEKVNGASKLEVARAHSDAAAAEADVTRIRVALTSAQRGIVTGEGGQDVPYSRQRLDQLALDIARLRAERDELKAEDATMVNGAVGIEHDAGGAVAVAAPAAGMLWQFAATPGERVLKGSHLGTLVDCSRVYLEATVTPHDGDRIDLSKGVVVRFAGTSTEVHGRVRSVRGGGLRPDDAAAAELTLTDTRGDSRVIIDLDARQIDQSAANFCQVGRNAKVFFDDKAMWRPLQALSQWVR
jgi:multidrug resistance efflux pump